MSDERTKTIVDSLRYMSGMEARLINSCLLSDAADIIERLAAPPAGDELASPESIAAVESWDDRDEWAKQQALTLLRHLAAGHKLLRVAPIEDGGIVVWFDAKPLSGIWFYADKIEAAGDVETGTVLGFLNRAARKPTEWWDFEREGQPTVAGVLAALMIYAVQDRTALEGK